LLRFVTLHTLHRPSLPTTNTLPTSAHRHKLRPPITIYTRVSTLPSLRDGLPSLREVISPSYIPWGAPPILFGLLSAGLPARGLVGDITVRSLQRGLACRVIFMWFFASFNKRMLPVGRPLLLVERGTGGSAAKFFTGANVFEQ
jgi:hypothetical protein